MARAPGSDRTLESSRQPPCPPPPGATVASRPGVPAGLVRVRSGTGAPGLRPPMPAGGRKWRGMPDRELFPRPCGRPTTLPLRRPTPSAAITWTTTTASSRGTWRPRYAGSGPARSRRAGRGPGPAASPTRWAKSTSCRTGRRGRTWPWRMSAPGSASVRAPRAPRLAPSRTRSASIRSIHAGRCRACSGGTRWCGWRRSTACWSTCATCRVRCRRSRSGGG